MYPTVPIDTSPITDEQRNRLLALVEGHFQDIKAKEITPAKLSRSVSAFANADGGDLYIGIRAAKGSGASHAWAGFARPEDANGHIQLLEGLFPLGDDYSYALVEHPNENGLVLQVTVRKSRAIVRSSDGTPYVRRGAQNLPVTTVEALRILERNKGITSFENETVPVDSAVVTNSEVVIRFMLE